ncbi:hypothetical protein NMY22_g16966 [Coprinellus aureogranulatus]|nr:hypothetical protein NMY22_g16966 [Coprinellus aureogranulatus]
MLRFPSMTSLEISACADFPRPHAKEFLKALTWMPLLETLKLWSCLPIVETSAATYDLPTVFSSLKILDIRDCPEYLNQFFQRTRCPGVVSAELLFEAEHDSSFAMQQSLDAILDFLCRPQEGTRVPLRQMRYSEVEVEMDFDALVPGDPTLRHLSIFFADEYTTTKFLDAVDKCFEFETLTLLKSNPGDYYRPTLWYADAWKFFTRLPNLETITLSNLQPPELRDMLQEALMAPDALTAPFPRLSKLEISSVTFEGEEEENRIDAALGMIVASLISAVKSRRTLTCPFPEVQLGKATRLNANHVSSIRERCPELDLVWDE